MNREIYKRPDDANFIDPVNSGAGVFYLGGLPSLYKTLFLLGRTLRSIRNVMERRIMKYRESSRRRWQRKQREYLMSILRTLAAVLGFLMTVYLVVRASR